MNVLLTAAGRRSYLVSYFREALRGDGLVLATNSVADTPAMLRADQALVVPPSHHPEYPETILEICRRHEVGLLCSFHDLDLLALAPHRETMRQTGVFAALPSVDWARVCLDKHECAVRLRALGFDAPRGFVSLAAARESIRRGEVAFPLAVKARLGYGSLALGRCANLEDLEALHRLTQRNLRDGTASRFLAIAPDEQVLIEEWIEGPELRIVIVNDFDGRHAAHFVTEVHAMRAGESDAATTLDAGALGDLPVRLAAAVGHHGVLGVDLIVRDGEPTLLDLNPRFTGDYPFQHLAGVDVPSALVAWARGAAPEPAWMTSIPGVSGYKDLVPARLPSSRPAGVDPTSQASSRGRRRTGG